jgi:prepilin peptidase CpaA
MLGQIEIPTLAILVLAVLAAGSDLAYGRIFNWLTVSMALFALVYSFMSQGFSGLGNSFLGILAGLALYGWMFWIRVLGGGDVKLLMAFGAWGGAHYALDVAVFGVVLGGIMSLVWLTLKGRIGNFCKRAYRFLLSLAVRELEVEKFEVDRKVTMPFGVPIAIAAVWVQLGSPLERWGVHL